MENTIKYLHNQIPSYSIKVMLNGLIDYICFRL